MTPSFGAAGAPMSCDMRRPRVHEIDCCLATRRPILLLVWHVAICGDGPPLQPKLHRASPTGSCMCPLRVGPLRQERRPLLARPARDRQGHLAVLKLLL